MLPIINSLTSSFCNFTPKFCQSSPNFKVLIFFILGNTRQARSFYHYECSGSFSVFQNGLGEFFSMNFNDLESSSARALKILSISYPVSFILKNIKMQWATA